MVDDYVLPWEESCEGTEQQPTLANRGEGNDSQEIQCRSHWATVVAGQAQELRHAKNA